MSNRNRFVQWVSASIAAIVLVSSVSAQVLPKNKDKDRGDTTKQDRNATPNVERDAQRAKDGGTEVDKQRTRTRGQTEGDVNRSTSTTVTTRSGGNILRSTQIVGTMVNVHSDQRLGKITEIVFNDGGCISYVVVDLDGKLAAIPWQAGNYDHQHRVFVLDNFEQSRVARIPTFTNFDQIEDEKYVTQVNSYFNVQIGARSEGRVDRDGRPTEAKQDATRTNRDSTRSKDSAKDSGKTSTTEAKEGAAAEPRSKSGAKSDPSKQPATSDKSDAQSDKQEREPSSTTIEPKASEKKSETATPDAPPAK